MSNLYIRVMTGFYTHRKTARLRSLIGDDAFWIPPRLWAYCAENQPDGNISSYSSDEIAMLVGCVKHSSSILQALKSSGFLDPDGIVHDWDAHNGYHKLYSERAKAAADARWSKKKEAKKKDIGHRTVDSGDKHCLTHACSIYDEYPKKVSKPQAITAIKKCLTSYSFEFLIEKTRAYKLARQGQDHQFTPNPATWFNGLRFNDDPSTWITQHATNTTNRNSGIVGHSPNGPSKAERVLAERGRAAVQSSQLRLAAQVDGHGSNPPFDSGNGRPS